MPDVNPNLIPPPSIGESRTSAPAPKIRTKGSKLWIVVLGCVVAGVGLGVFVYQRSIAPGPVTTPRPAVSPRPSPAVSPSPVTPDISVVTPQSNTITFPKAGEIRVYFALYGSNPTVPNHLIRLKTATGEADVTMPQSVPAGDKMVVRDSGLEVAAGQTVTIESYDRGDMTKKSIGWILPASNKCGDARDIDIAPYVTWATGKAGTEPLVSTQCWNDWDPPNDTTNIHYGNFLVILSYVPASQASPNPSVSASPTASRSPSPSPAASKSPSPSPAGSKSPSPSPVGSKSPSPSPAGSKSPSPIASTQVSPSPSASARVTMPEGSSLPDAGIFEVTAGTMGVGMILILLGILGLLLM